jgi:pyruvate/2-oxoglutarate/acetoin dehydrogenase E1 component
LATLTYLEAIRLALAEEMRRDERVFLMGEDIGAYGGAFKVTAGLLEEFGPERVIDTPIAEAGIIGAAIGAALMGRRPVVEMQFIDFISNGFQLLTNFAAKCHYRWGAAVPMVVRGPCGGGVGAGPFHSQNVEAFFMHTPGLKIVAPATPGDARGLLKAAIRDPNPVLYFEHKFLYRHLKEEVDERDEGLVEIGKAAVRRKGDDVTIVTFGAMVHRALAAAEALAGEGLSAEVIDLRSLLPWDREAVIQSVQRTGRLLVVHEAPRTGGVGGELAAEIGECCFEWLDAPVTRLAAADVPVPFHPDLERAVLPSVEAIAERARALRRY